MNLLEKKYIYVMPLRNNQIISIDNESLIENTQLYQNLLDSIKENEAYMDVATKIEGLRERLDNPKEFRESMNIQRELSKEREKLKQISQPNLKILN